MIRKLRTERDNQQWMLDLALNMRGRVQNFERDDIEVPSGKRARNYRMLPKTDVQGEADDVGKALAYAQAHAADWGGDPIPGTPAEFWKIHTMETEKWAKVVKAAGIKGE